MLLNNFRQILTAAQLKAPYYVIIGVPDKVLIYACGKSVHLRWVIFYIPFHFQTYLNLEEKWYVWSL